MRTSRLNDFFDTYTKDLTADDLQRLFTRDTRDASCSAPRSCSHSSA